MTWMFLSGEGERAEAYRRRFAGEWLRALALVVAACLAGNAEVLAAEGRVQVLIGSVDGRQGDPSPEKVNEPFAIDFDAHGVLYGVEFTRGNRVFRSTKPIHEWPARGELSVDFIAGAFRVTKPGRDEAFTTRGLSPATDQAIFSGMHDLAVSTDGRIFLADTFHHCLRELSQSLGKVSLLAGAAEPGDAGDGAALVEARFNEPYCCSLAPDGTMLLIADIRNHRLRAIDITTQTVATIAGNGEPGTPIDDAVATESPLAGPRAACMADDGTVYLVLREGNALVAIRDGRLRTVVNAAGTRGYSGDGGPGRAAQLSGPKYVCMDRSGGVLIVDTENHCVRCYDPATEQIDLVAGVPPKAGAAVGEDWRQTELRRPHGARIAPDGRLLIADSDNDRVLIGPYDSE